MEEFEIVQPSQLLAPYVKHYWFLRTNAASQATQRIIPTGFISLVFHRGERLYSLQENDLQPHSFLCGQETGYSDLRYSGMVDMISIVFQSIGAKAFFRIPMSEIKEQMVEIDALSDHQLRELEKQLTGTMDNKICVTYIEQFLLKRICRFEEYNLKRLVSVIQSINGGQMGIASLAGVACLGYKQFKRIFTEYIGTNPKDYLRVIRFQKALHTLQTNPQISLTGLAYECDYYDQPHLIKEFKTFSGYTPVEYLSVYAPYSDYFS
jgi:AraC-like DNA-binding protein